MNLRDDDRLDHWLDAALRQYTNAEPRPGLEQRLLATVSLAQRHSARRRTWTLAFASLLLICAVGIGVWMSISLRDRSEVARVTQKPIAAQDLRTIAPVAKETHPPRVVTSHR